MEKNYTNIKERVLTFRKSKGYSIETFLSSIGMTYGSFKGKAKEGSLNSDAIVEIYTKYPDINLVWLLTGNGEMLNGPEKVDLSISKTIKKDAKDNTDIIESELIASLKQTVCAQQETIESHRDTIDLYKKLIQVLYDKAFPTHFISGFIDTTEHYTKILERLEKEKR